MLIVFRYENSMLFFRSAASVCLCLLGVSLLCVVSLDACMLSMDVRKLRLQCERRRHAIVNYAQHWTKDKKEGSLK